MHPWVGAGPDDCRHLLEELGLDSLERLFDTIPPKVSVDRVDLPPGQDEDTVRRALSAVADRNLTLSSRPSFLGAGVYRHIQPALVDAVLSRAEFFTSYTPYQPEISQGTLQVIFEFQTLISQLTGCEVANASLYDGATSMVEAVLFAQRVLRCARDRVLVAETVHPVYRSVLDTYARAVGLEVVVVPPGSDGRTDPGRLRDEQACCVVVQSPSFLGVVEDLPAIAESAHASGALAVQVVTEAVSLGVLAGGGAFGFDAVCGEAQSFGVAPGFGGPHLGFFACSEKNVRQMPGRLTGETVDEEGRRAFCLTLATREQHIRRARATSNICTNQGLMALAATVWLEALGGSGLRGLARSCLARSHELKRRISGLGGGWRLSYPAAPTFNEFLVEGPAGGDELARRLADHGVLAGFPSRRWGGTWPDGLLIAVTECNRAADLDALVAAMRRVS
jgi:glycine dehydrogenase subunit 1